MNSLDILFPTNNNKQRVNVEESPHFNASNERVINWKGGGHGII
jgi:hypothetical protein